MHTLRSAAAGFAVAILLHAAALPAAAAPAGVNPQSTAGSKPVASWKDVPGVVIDHSPASSGLYIGSPGLAVLPNGDYLASHDFFGPKSDEFQCPAVAVFRSSDRGQSWKQTARLQCLFWPSLFTHNGAAYLLGTDKHHGRLVIRRSTDGGVTWTEPKDSATGLLTPAGQYHTALGRSVQAATVISHKDIKSSSLRRFRP